MFLVFRLYLNVLNVLVKVRGLVLYGFLSGHPDLQISLLHQRLHWPYKAIISLSIRDRVQFTDLGEIVEFKTKTRFKGSWLSCYATVVCSHCQCQC